ncbi:hypothetical protein [Methylomonas sp. MgM2]
MPLKANVDLSHRLEPISFYDNIAPALQRAAAIADLLEVATDTSSFDAFEPKTIKYASQAIRMELADVKAMLEAYDLLAKGGAE